MGYCQSKEAKELRKELRKIQERNKKRFSETESEFMKALSEDGQYKVAKVACKKD